jgi:hypothetical protein
MEFVFKEFLLFALKRSLLFATFAGKIQTERFPSQNCQVLTRKSEPFGLKYNYLFAIEEFA